MKFVRFTVVQKLYKDKRETGLFTAAKYLLEEASIEPDVREQLEHLVQWFDTYLPIPHQSLITPETIFWYQPTAKEFIGAMWKLAHILANEGFTVNLVTTDFPGLAVYQDEVQIAAIPRRDCHRG